MWEELRVAIEHAHHCDVPPSLVVDLDFRWLAAFDYEFCPTLGLSPDVTLALELPDFDDC